MNPLSMLLWVALPYIAAAVFIVGHIWRYRYDKFGWTTRSSQSYENRLLRWGSPMFHFGILCVVAGHLVGLLVERADGVGAQLSVLDRVVVERAVDHPRQLRLALPRAGEEQPDVLVADARRAVVGQTGAAQDDPPQRGGQVLHPHHLGEEDLHRDRGQLRHP